MPFLVKKIYINLNLKDSCKYIVQNTREQKVSRRSISTITYTLNYILKYIHTHCNHSERA